MDNSYLDDTGDPLEGLPNDPIEEALQSLSHSQQQIAQSQAQVAQMLNHIAQLQQQTVQALGQVAQSLQGLGNSVKAAAGPRRRIPIRDQDGRITEAHDVPMSMQ